MGTEVTSESSGDWLEAKTVDWLLETVTKDLIGLSPERNQRSLGGVEAVVRGSGCVEGSDLSLRST